MTPTVRRIASLLGLTVAALCALAVVALALLTHSAYGREHVRRIVVDVAARRLTGSLYLGALRFGPGCAVGADSLVLRDSGGTLVVATGALHARCAPVALFRGRLVIRELAVERPRLVFSKGADGMWNWERAIRRDSVPRPRREGPARIVVHGPARISGGDVLLARQTAAGVVRTRRWTGIVLDAADLRTDYPGMVVAAELTRLGATSSSPPLTLRDARGSVRVSRGGLTLDLARVALAGSTGRAAGRLTWGVPGGVQIDISGTLDTAALADFTWIHPAIPAEGSGRVHLRARSAAGAASIVDYELTDIDLGTHRSRLRGAATIVVGGPVLTVRNVALDLAPLHTDLLQALVGRPMPADLRGAFTGRVVARGGSLRHFVIDSANLYFADARVPSAVSRVGVTGALDIHAPARTTFHGLRVRAAPLELRTLARASPTLRRIGGSITGTAILDSAWTDLRVSGADLTYQAPGAAATAPMRVQGGGRVTLDDGRGAGLRYDLDLATHPLVPSVLAHAYPVLRGVASADGRLRISGVPSALSIAADLRGPGGALLLDANIDVGPALVAHARGRVRGLDPRVALGRAALPDGGVDADFDLTLTTGDPATRRATVALRNVGGRLAGLELRPSTVHLRLGEGRLSADTVTLATAQGTLRATGALGLIADVRDSLHIELRSDSLGALVTAMRRAGAGSAPSGAPPAALDSLAGALAVDAHAIGSTDSFDLDATAQLSGAVTTKGSAARVRVTTTALDLPRSRRGRAVLRVDSLTVAGVVVRGAEVEAATNDGVAWRAAIRTSDADRIGGRAAGSVHLDSISTTGAIDSVELRLPGSTLRSTGIARFLLARGGRFILDALELRSGNGASLRLAASANDSTHIDAIAQARSAPLRLSTDTAAHDSATAVFDLDARVRGTRAEPVVTLRSSIRGDALGAFDVDSVVLLGEYAARQARGRLVARGQSGGARADVTLPAAISLAPFGAGLLSGPMRGDVVADNLALASLGWLLPVVRATAGTIAGRVQLDGQLRRPVLTGELTLRGGAFSVPALGTGAQDVSATIALAHDSATIRSLSLRGDTEPYGRAELTGVVSGLADSAGPLLDLRLSATKLPVLRARSTGDADASAELRLAGPLSKATLSGAITVDRAELRIADVGRRGIVGRDDPEYVRLLDSLTASGVAVDGAKQSAFMRGLRLEDVRVSVGPDVWLRSAEANVKLGGAVDLTTPVGQSDSSRSRLALRGSVATERGTYTVDAGVVRRTFQLERGGVEFTGEPELDPRLDINAIYAVPTANDPRAPGRELRIRAHLGGTLTHPELKLSAADGPERSEAELLSYLVTGESEVSLGGGQLVEREVGAALVSRATSGLTKRVTGDLFDVVSVTTGAASDQPQGLGNTTANIFAGSRLGLGKQLSRRTFLTVSAGLCSLAPNTGTDASGVDATSFGDAIGVSLDYRFRPDAGASLSSEPPTSALLCTSASVGRGFAPTPRQWGTDLFKGWRF
jgi:translocation and assembly module TamB